jgi:hypothetical protein
MPKATQQLGVGDSRRLLAEAIARQASKPAIDPPKRIDRLSDTEEFREVWADQQRAEARAMREGR